MPADGADPYAVLGVAPSAPDGELRAAYRRLAQLHHPDHNGGSPESARRFAAIQEAYAEVRLRRSTSAAGAARQGAAGETPSPGDRVRADGSTDAPDGRIESRIEELERELRVAKAAREKAAAAARKAAAKAGGRRATDEELGYYRTEDSFTKILADAAHEVSEIYDEARRSGAGRTLEEMLDDVLDRFRGGSGR
jgi:curved DNA-binding protein CbpA